MSRNPTRSAAGREAGLAATRGLVEADWRGGRTGPRPAPTGGGVYEVRPDSARPLRVLVVDDSRDFADTSLVLLGLWGHDGRAAYGGQEALDVVEVFRPDVFLLDIGMPRLCGYELARCLRSRFREALLVAVTGYAHDRHRALGEEAGFDLYLAKPVDPSALKTLLLLEWERLAEPVLARHSARTESNG